MNRNRHYSLEVAGCGAGTILGDAAAELERGGADLMVLATNTMHKVSDRIEERIQIPLIHIGDATAAAVRGAGLRPIGLLGTAFTLEQDFLIDRLASHDLEVKVPPAEDRAEVHRIIYDELCRGIVTEQSRSAYLKIIGRLVDRGCQGVILGCTEIELLLPLDQIDGIPLFRPVGSTSRQRSRSPWPVDSFLDRPLEAAQGGEHLVARDVQLLPDQVGVAIVP